LAVPYQYLRSDEFPELELGDSISSKVQTSLPWGDPTAESSVTYLGLADNPAFERYEVLHQVERDVDAYVNQQPVRRLLENRRFHAFLHRERSYWLISTKRRDAQGVFERLARDHDSVAVSNEQIDLRTISSLGSTTGAYFGNLRIDKVRTAAVFGSTTVVESEEWEHYSELGELSVVYMRVMADDGETRTLMVMRDRGVNLMRDTGERLNLAFVAALQDSIAGLT
jgi:hypothetical protein